MGSSDKPDKQAQRILETLRRLFPRNEIQRLLDEVAERRTPCSVFRTFVWHTMAKTAAERVAKRRWELVDGDLRHKATQMAVIYTMHCIYERKAKGVCDSTFDWEDAELWNWDSKAG